MKLDPDQYHPKIVETRQTDPFLACDIARVFIREGFDRSRALDLASEIVFREREMVEMMYQWMYEGGDGLREIILPS